MIKRHFIKKIFKTKDHIRDCKYSPDGSLIAINFMRFGCCILDPKSDLSKFFSGNKNNPLCAIVFHPTSFILATLSLKHDRICYWNTKKIHCISITPLKERTDHEEHCLIFFNNRMDFSPDGTKLIVALDDKCLVLKVPFKALYKDLKKNKVIFTYWLLKNYQRNQNNMIPDEIIHLLIKYILAASQYSLTNY